MDETTDWMIARQRLAELARRERGAVREEIARSGLWYARVEGVTATGRVLLGKFPGEAVPVFTRFEPRVGDLVLGGWVGLAGDAQPVVFGAMPDRDATFAVRNAAGLASLIVDPTTRVVTMPIGVKQVGGGPVYVPHDVNTGTVASTTSTTTFAQHLSVGKVLDAGTWDVVVLFWGTYFNSVANGGIVARVEQPVSDDELVFDLDTPAFARVTLHTVAVGEVASNGIAPTAFAAGYRANTAGTVTSRAGMILGICTRLQ